MSRKTIKELKVTVTFEPSRIQDSHFVKAYETAMPLVKRLITTETVECIQENKSFKSEETLI